MRQGGDGICRAGKESIHFFSSNADIEKMARLRLSPTTAQVLEDETNEDLQKKCAGNDRGHRCSGRFAASRGVKCYAVANSNFSFVIWGNRTGAKNFSGYK